MWFVIELNIKMQNILFYIKQQLYDWRHFPGWVGVLHVEFDCDHQCNIIYYSFLHFELNLVLIQSDHRPLLRHDRPMYRPSGGTTFEFGCTV